MDPFSLFDMFADNSFATAYVSQIVTYRSLAHFGVQFTLNFIVSFESHNYKLLVFYLLPFDPIILCNDKLFHDDTLPPTNGAFLLFILP